MAVRRPPSVKNPLERLVWERAAGQCLFPPGPHPIPVDACHIDHIVPLTRGGTHTLDNLRVLCRRHYVLRSTHVTEHRIVAALRDGVIPSNWRELVWDEGEP
jgi:5-methylcytosine-specific restriction enzyme A